MGLDQNIYVTHNKETEVKNYTLSQLEEVAYWRKEYKLNNYIHAISQKKHHNYIDNGAYFLLEKRDLIDIYKDIPILFDDDEAIVKNQNLFIYLLRLNNQGRLIFYTADW